MSDQIGIFEGVSFDEYERIDALNGSKLVYMRRSPMHFRYMIDNPSPSTSAQILGTAAHRILLEPENVGDYAIWEKAWGRRFGKKWDEFLERNAGKIVLTDEEAQDMIGIAVSARKSPLVRKYLAKDGACEVTMVWRDLGAGRLMKGRCDKIIAGKESALILDLKTTRDCHPFKFGRQAFALNYHIKAAHYVSGYQTLTGIRPKFKFIAIDNKPPYEPAVYRATADVILQGGADREEILRRLGECEKTGIWPPEMEEESDLILPPSAYTDTDDLSELELATEG